LDPLLPHEIKLTREIILKNSTTLPSKRRIPPQSNPARYIFNYITLLEPPKSVLLPYFLVDKEPPVSVYPRKSFTILIDRETSNAFELVVNLDTETVESFTQLPEGSVPSLSPEDLLQGEDIARSDVNVQRRCALLGYPNMTLVNADPWSIGYIKDRQENGDKEFQSKRLIQLYLYGKQFDGDNAYGRS
jgi:Cu2+-containing amine oxidase